MTAIDRARVAMHLAATGGAARSKALEDLITYVFGLIPGVCFTTRNQLNSARSEEIDVAFWNDADPQGLRQFGPILLVECKNWSKPVRAAEVTMFESKLRKHGRPLGILVAAAGITGDPSERTAAHGILSDALADDVEILVITRTEIEQLTDTDALVELLKRKKLQLTVSGSIFEAS